MTFSKLKIGIITISNTRTIESDRSGPAVVHELKILGFTNFETALVKDDVPMIQSELLRMSEICAAIFTSGGTGFSPPDVTPEATLQVIERQANSISEFMRSEGLKHSSYSHLSRGICGIRGKCLIVNLPGSPKASTESLVSIAHLLEPIISQLQGEPCSAH